MAAERFANDIQTTLTSGIDAVVTIVPVASATGFPSSAQYRIRVDDELMLVTAGAGANSWTVTRGIEGTTAATHANGTNVVHVVTAGALGGVSDPAAGVPGLRTLGTGAAQAASGTDSRLSDARTPTAHTHPSSDVASGTLATARLGSGTANSGVFLRGDQSWAAPAGGTGVPTVVNVKDAPYNAVGDGVNDDTAEIQAALTAAGTGGLVWFPKGQYKVSDQGSGFCLDISTLSGITLAGASSALTNPSGEGPGACIFTTSTSTKIIKCEAAALNHRGPKVLDLRIESRSASAMGFSLIDFNHYVFERVAFRGVGSAGSTTSTGLRIEGVEDASYGRIEGCHFHRHLYGCVTVNSVGATFAGSCYFDANSANHVLLDIKGGSAISVHGAKFQGDSTGGASTVGAIGIRGGTPGGVISGDVEFIGNNFEGCTTGINLSAPASLTTTETMVIGNSFTGVGPSDVGIIVGTNRRHDQIIGNRFINVATSITDNGTDTLQIGGRVAGALGGEFMRLGGVYVGSGTAAPTAAAVDGSLYLRSGTGVYQRAASAWSLLGGSGSLTNSANYLTTDVTMTTAGTYYDGPTLTLAAGTWLLIGSVQLNHPTDTAVRMWTAKLWNGASNIFATAVHRTTGTSQTPRVTMHLSALVTPASSTTFLISATSTANGDLFQGSGVGGGSYLNAVKIA